MEALDFMNALRYRQFYDGLTFLETTHTPCNEDNKAKEDNFLPINEHFFILR